MLKFETSSLLTSEYEPPEIKSTGEGELEIWKVDGSSRAAIRTDRYGHFFSGNTYPKLIFCVLFLPSTWSSFVPPVMVLKRLDISLHILTILEAH
jgi:hypothetical protein